MFIPVDQDAEGVAAWIWHNLVPPSGRARSVQGELLRAVEQLRWEAQTNGNVNWDERFESHVQFLEDVLSGEASFSAEAKALIARDLERLRTFITPADLGTREGALPYVEDDLYDRLVHSIVAFCREHPATIQPG